MCKSVLLLILLLTYTKCGKGDDLEFTPASGKIYVAVGDTFTMGFSKSDNITRCCFETHNDYRSFDVSITKLSVERTFPLQRKNYQVDLLGQSGECKIKVLVKNTDFPYTWEITALYNNGLPSKKQWVFIDVLKQDDLVFLPKSKKIRVMEGEDYTAGFAFHRGIKSCFVDVDNVIFPIIQNSDYTRPTERQDNEILVEHENFHHYGRRGICRIKVRNAKVDSINKLTFFIQNQFGEIIEAESVQVEVYSKLSLTFTPASHQLYVPIDQEYQIGFNQHPLITRCYYETSSRISESFPVNNMDETLDDEYSLEEPIELTDSVWVQGLRGACAIRVKNVTERGPTEIKLIAANGRKNLTDHLFHIHYYYKTPILSQHIDILEGGSFVQYLKHKPFHVKKCTLHFGDEIIDFHTEHDSKYPNLKPIDYEYGLCGFKFNDFPSRLKDEVEWHLVLTNINGLHFGNSFTVNFIKATEVSDVIVNHVTLGSDWLLKCNPESLETVFCDIYNNRNELISQSSSCSYFIKDITMQDIGTWKCLASVKGSMEIKTYFVSLFQQHNQPIFCSVVEGFYSFTLGCNSDLNQEIKSCQITSPTNESFIIHQSLAIDRYSCLDTNLKIGHCSLQIEKPLAEEERGIWKMEINTGKEIFNTGLKLTEEEEPYQKEMAIELRASENLFINCDIPRVSQYCYISSPNGDLFMDYETYQPEIGRCSLNISANYSSKNGIWICYFANEMGEDDQVKINVKVGETSPSFSSMQIASNETKLQLMCLSGGEPIKYCFFLPPDSQSYHVIDNDSSENLRYYGKGLQYGECGIEIKKIEPTHFGNWTCIYKIGTDPTNQPITSTIFVHDGRAESAPVEAEEKDPEKEGAKLAMLFILGAIVLTALIIGFFYLLGRYRQRGIVHEIINFVFTPTPTPFS